MLYAQLWRPFMIKVQKASGVPKYGNFDTPLAFDVNYVGGWSEGT